jgi:hypothetical protein
MGFYPFTIKDQMLFPYLMGNGGDSSRCATFLIFPKFRNDTEVSVLLISKFAGQSSLQVT